MIAADWLGFAVVVGRGRGSVGQARETRPSEFVDASRVAVATAAGRLDAELRGPA